MRLFEYNYRLKNYLSDRARVPYDTGNLQANGFNVKSFGANQFGLVIGDARQVPYVLDLELGFTRTLPNGRTMHITKHKGWASRGAREFAQIVAKELGGVVTYD